jgi:pyruvate dehydrogenase E2 component (dihydrolipoamide acetyltransferase)
MAYKLELPDIGEGVVEAEVQQWFVQPGDQVVEDQPLVEVMTDKATVTIPSPRRGRVVRLYCNAGEVARVHTPLIELELEEGEAAPTPAASGPPRLEETAAPVLREADALPAGRRALATPAVRAMARHLGLDIQSVPGSGPGGRVTKDDLAAFRGQPEGGAGNGHSTGLQTAATPLPAPGGAAGGVPAAGDERVPLRGLRKRMAENMARSKRTAAHFTFVEQADVTELVRVKERIAEAAKEEGVKVTFLPFVVKAAVAALRKHPRLNAALDEERGEIVLKRRYDIGIASATEQGLIVPVVRSADQRSLLDLAREIERLAADSRAGRSRPEDLGRSTFTITSLGALGGLFATPVLNHPEVGILGIHRIRPTPVVKDGQVVVRDVVHVSVTSDHRVVDGHEVAAFAYQVIRYLEDPNLLLMQMV